MFRGHYKATVDDRGRIKLPAQFLGVLREKSAEELYVTSLDGSYVRLYPLHTWVRIEEKLMSIPSMTPARNKLLDRVTFFGQVARLDKMGRIVIPQGLRASACLDSSVLILGFLDYMELWNHDEFAEKIEKEGFSDEDKRLLSELGI